MEAITLYYGFRESLSSDTPFLASTKVSKIEDVKKITKGISISKYTNPEKKTIENGNFYALVTEEFTVCPLGILEPSQNKKQRNIYVGQKVFTTTKEDLCEYYRIQAKKKIEKLEEVLECSKRLLQQSRNITENDYSTRFYNNKINYSLAYITRTQEQYKEIVEKIKKL